MLDCCDAVPGSEKLPPFASPSVAASRDSVLSAALSKQTNAASLMRQHLMQQALQQAAMRQQETLRKAVPQAEEPQPQIHQEYIPVPPPREQQDVAIAQTDIEEAPSAQVEEMPPSQGEEALPAQVKNVQLVQDEEASFAQAEEAPQAPPAQAKETPPAQVEETPPAQDEEVLLAQVEKVQPAPDGEAPPAQDEEEEALFAAQKALFVQESVQGLEVSVKELWSCVSGLMEKTESSKAEPVPECSGVTEEYVQKYARTYVQEYARQYIHTYHTLLKEKTKQTEVASVAATASVAETPPVEACDMNETVGQLGESRDAAGLILELPAFVADNGDHIPSAVMTPLSSGKRPA